MAFRHGGKLGPFAREAEPEQPVALGPSDAGKPATNIRLLAQILAVCKLPMHRRASHMRRHADTLRERLWQNSARALLRSAQVLQCVERLRDLSPHRFLRSPKARWDH
jgi:hypothetical protein